MTFERTTSAYRVPREQWVFKLAPQITGKAQQAFAYPIDTDNYDMVKASILRRYNISKETYRQRLRSVPPRRNGETHGELAIRVVDLMEKWSCVRVGEVRELMALEQLLNTLPTDVRVWISERKPKNRERENGDVKGS